MGYLDYDSYSRTYMPTMRIATLGNWVQGALFGEGRILALMKRMSEATGETIAIGTQSDLFAQYIHIIPSQHTIGYQLKPGTVRPLARSGLGQLLLSARPDDTVDRLLRRINIEDAPDRRTPLPDLMIRIRDIRQRGCMSFPSTTYRPGPGSSRCCLPVRRHGRVLAIGVGGLVDRLEQKEEQILHELREGIATFADSTKADPLPIFIHVKICPAT